MAATITLALAIAATGAIIGAVHGLLLGSIGIHEPGRLVIAWETHAANAQVVEVSYRNFKDWQASSRSFTHVAAVGSSAWPMVLEGSGDPVKLATIAVSGSFFDTLGARPHVRPASSTRRRSAGPASPGGAEPPAMAAALRQRSGDCRQGHSWRRSARNSCGRGIFGIRLPARDRPVDAGRAIAHRGQRNARGPHGRRRTVCHRPARRWRHQRCRRARVGRAGPSVFSSRGPIASEPACM